jgi:DNA-directed RNA polymerase I, II, and III subunit RPABC1
MKDRGYSDPPRIKNDVRFFSAPSLDTIELYLLNEPKIGIGHIKNYVREECSHYIFIASTGITPKARKTCKNYQLHNVFIEVFLVSELLFNPTKHVYCPSHRLCSVAEATDVLEKLGVSHTDKYDKLPRILAKDPIMRYYGLREGNLIEITRDSLTMPGYPEITYRIVTGSNL